MTRKPTHPYPIVWSIFLALLMLAILGCGRSTDLATDISGKWKSAQNSDQVEIYLTKEASSLTIGGQTIDVHHIKQHADLTGAMKGTLDREVYYSVKTGLMVKLHVLSKVKGLANLTIDRKYLLKSLTPKK